MTALDAVDDVFHARAHPSRRAVLERVVDVPPERVWPAWTRPEHVKRWFTPAPWQTVDCEIDLCPRGMFRTVMRSPDETGHPNVGCFLEIVEHRKLVWTDALEPGHRPSPSPFMTAIILLEPSGAGTRYTAIALHQDAAGRQQHEEMGFREGWGKALDQLVAHAKTL